VFVLFALGAGGGSPVSIAGATQDAVVLFAETTSNGSGQLVSSSCGNSHSTPAAFFRPVSMCDILVVGWGSLLVSKSGGGRGSQAGLEGTALRVSQIQAHCFTEAGDCCPYIAIYATDTFVLQSQGVKMPTETRTGCV